MDHFEEKLDKLADTKDIPDWMSQLYNKFPSPDMQDVQDAGGDWGGAEASILYTTWEPFSKYRHLHANSLTI